MADFNTSYNIDIVYNNSKSWPSAGNRNMPAFDMPVIVQMDRVLCVVFGIPFNLVALNFVRSKHRRFSGHSGMFWVTVIVFNIFFNLPAFHKIGNPLTEPRRVGRAKNVFLSDLFCHRRLSIRSDLDHLGDGYAGPLHLDGSSPILPELHH